MKEIIITQSDANGKRLDSYLAEKLFPRFSRNQIQHSIAEGKVSVNGQIKKPHYRLTANQKIEIVLPDLRQPSIKAQDIHLDVVYEDADILVVNKPEGMVVHPASGSPSGTLVNAALYHTKGRLSHAQTSTRPGIVHRLDKEVSGLMVIAKTDAADHLLVAGFKSRNIKRRYIAFVKGTAANDEGSIVLPIGRALRDRKKMAVRFLNAKDATTHYKVLRRFPTYTKLRVELETGRTHQIRVHMAYIGHPIIGDIKYGGPRYDQVALYAAELSFLHPITSKQLHFSIPMPAGLKRLDAGQYS